MFLALQDEAGKEVCRRQVSESRLTKQVATELVNREMSEIATRHKQLAGLLEQFSGTDEPANSAASPEPVSE